MTVDPTVSRLAAAGVAYAPQIAEAAKRHDVDPCLLAAVAAQETGGPGTNAGRNVVGDGGHGRGLFQIDDRWHAFAKTAQAMDPAQNAGYAAGMLHDLLAKYGNVREALSAYNAGSPYAAGTQTQWAGRSLGYADSVMRHYADIAGGVAGGASGAVVQTPFAPTPMAAPAFATPASAPAFPSLPHSSYHRQPTDYSGLFDSDDSSIV